MPFVRAALGALTLMFVAVAAEATMSEVRIITEPEGADVWAGSLHLGTTTRDGLRVLLEKPITAVFTIRKPGYETVERAVRVTPLWELPYWSLQHPPPMVVVVPLEPVTAETPPRESGATTGEGSRAEEQRPTLQIPRVSQPPKLEDFLKGKPREGAGARITDFRQREPRDGARASRETSAYLSYDRKNLYVVVVCREEPEKIRARMAQREDIGSDDQVAIYLDTFHDQRRAYLFATNPLGVQSDLILTEGQNPDLNFDAVWRSKGRLTSYGFVVWMAIPFKSLRFPSGPEQKWGIALGRFVPHNQEGSFWPHITNRIEGFSRQMATLEGMTNIASGSSVQFIPYGVFSRGEYPASSQAFGPQEEMRGGLDAKVVVAGAFALDGTLNPDFSQVEADDPQVTVNERFEVYFPEKRPFFTENSGVFDTPVRLFFPRRIVDPHFGVKLTGKAGGWSVGALAMKDRPLATEAALDSSRPPDAEIGVVRLQRDLKEESALGLLATSRQLGPDFNRVLSLDSRLKISPNAVLSGQVMRSETSEANGSKLSGSGYFANLLYSSRNFTYGGGYQDLDPNFRTSLGFVPRVGIRQTDHYAGYVWWPGSRVLLNLGPSISGLVNWDRQGRLQDWYVGAELSALFSGPTQLKVARSESFEVFEGQSFRKSGINASFYTEGLNWLGLSATYAQGTDVNYYPPRGLSPFLANSVGGSVGLTLRPSSRMRLEQTYIYNRLGGPMPSAPALQDTVYVNQLGQLRVNYQFTRALSVRATLAYEAVTPDESLVQLEHSRRVDWDVLFAWTLKPGTALYVGYNTRYGDAADPLTTPAQRFPRLPGTLASRELFIKLSYLLRF